MLTPGQIITYVWKSKEFLTLIHESLNNLHEQTTDEKGFIDKNKFDPTTIYNDSLLNFRLQPHYHFKWNIEEKNIKEELDRQMIDQVSFVFALKWF